MTNNIDEIIVLLKKAETTRSLDEAVDCLGKAFKLIEKLPEDYPSGKYLEDRYTIAVANNSHRFFTRCKGL